MTEIRVGTPETSQASSYRANIQLQGFAAGSDGQEAAGVLVPRAKDPGAGAYPETSARIHSSSVRSEPDLDTIMPLPGSYRAHAQYSPGLPIRSRSSGRDGSRGAGARGAEDEASDGSSEEEIEAERSLLHSPRSIGFMNVEVSLNLASLAYKQTVLFTFLSLLYTTAPSGWSRHLWRRLDGQGT